MSDGFTLEDRKAITDLTTAVAVLTKEMGEHRKVMFGEQADGFLYQFAAIKKDIESIPSISERVAELAIGVRGMEKGVDSVLVKIGEHEKTLADHSDDIKDAKTTKRVLIAVASTVSTGVTLILTWLAGLFDLFHKSPPTLPPH